MSQTEQHCACDPSKLVMLPVRGFGLAVDPSGLAPAPGPATACRERVDQDMHIYIDGNLSESGDGLSPETAVKSYADAVLALSRYDGCNTHAAHFHFADLDGADDAYPDLGVFPHNYATFRTLAIAGVSHETTNLGTCIVHPGCEVYISDACLTCARNFSSFVQLRSSIAFNPRNKKYAIMSQYGGVVSCAADSEIYFHSGTYASCVFVMHSMFYNSGSCKFHTLGPVSVETGFLCGTRNAAINLNEAVDYTNCTAVSGKKYYANFLSNIYTGGKTLPGSLDGQVYNGSIYA